MAGLLTIELKDLHIWARHGLHEEEWKIENEYKVDITLSVKAPKTIIHSIEETINYVEVYRIVQEEFALKKELLETCAMLIGERIVQKFPEVKSISVFVQKLNPPITNFTGSVGVCYSRRFK